MHVRVKPILGDQTQGGMFDHSVVCNEIGMKFRVELVRLWQTPLFGDLEEE